MGDLGDFCLTSNALVQTRIDAEVKERATAVLKSMGLTVPDAVRILLTRTANEGALPLELVSNDAAHDAWFRSKVIQALEDTRADVEDEDAETRFRERPAVSDHDIAQLTQRYRHISSRADPAGPGRWPAGSRAGVSYGRNTAPLYQPWARLRLRAMPGCDEPDPYRRARLNRPFL